VIARLAVRVAHGSAIPEVVRPGAVVTRLDATVADGARARQVAVYQPQRHALVAVEPPRGEKGGHSCAMQTLYRAMPNACARGK
jgi:hypothetical protein